MADSLTDLGNLAIERAQIMERLQQIDDQASKLLTQLDTETIAERKRWDHLLPKDRPRTPNRFISPTH